MNREYPYQARDLSEIPDRLRQSAYQTLPPGELAKTIFLIPGQLLAKKLTGAGGMHWVPEQLLVFTEQGVLHVQASKLPKEKAQANYLPGSSLLYGRVILVLLYGRMELCGVVDGFQKQIVIEYNSVSHELMQPAYLNFLRLAWQPAVILEANNYQNMLLGRLEDQSYKFRSGLEKHCLQKDEFLQSFVFQRRMLKTYLRIFHKLIAPASLVAITDRQLILIEEGTTSATSYGYFFTYCPRQNVVGIERRPKDRLEDICVTLRKDGSSIEHQLTQETANAEAFQALWGR